MEKYRTQCIKGKIYAYVDSPYWNAEKKRGEHKRTYIGRVVDGKLVPNKRYLLQLQLEKQQAAAKPGPVPATECKRLFYGATYLFDQITKKTGIAPDLEACFGDAASQILAIAYYLVLEEGQPMYRFQKWSLSHWQPHDGELSSQRISEFFRDVYENQKMEYFRRQAMRCAEREYMAFDTTSISSYSETIRQVKYGKNKEGDDLPQINLALLYGEKSLMPVYYRKLAGNIPDVKTVKNLLKDIDFLELEKLSLVMDRGFYSTTNINDLMKHHHKFLIALRTSLKLVSSHLEQDRDEFVTRTNYDSGTHLYVRSYTDWWDYSEEKPRSGEILTGKRRIYIHIYFNDQRCTDERNRFNHLLDKCEAELRIGKHVPEHENLYRKYFFIHETPVRGKTISYNEDAIRKAEKDYGFFALMSNGIKDPIVALRTYRLRDMVEKSFNNLKDRLSMRRMSVSSEEGFEGKLFVQFVALEIMSYIKKHMDENDLYRNYTMQSLLDEIDTIEYYQQPGRAHHLSEITEKQRMLYGFMDVEVPT